MKFQAVNSPLSPLDSLERSEQNRVLTKLVEDIDDLIRVIGAGVTESWLERFRSQFVPIDGGKCVVGDNELYHRLHGLPEHEVAIDPFRLSQYVVTQSEWTAIMNTQPWFNEGNVKYGSDIPATYMNWYDTNDFVRKINRVDSEFIYRLPREAEWEYAARGGNKAAGKARTKFSFGDDPNQLMQYGWYDWYDQNASLRGHNYAHPVGELSPNQLGLYDMHGNVWEWTADDVDGLRALRGGGFNFMAEGACSAFRVVQKPEVKGEAVGFRLVQERRS
jgi:formylglycine-generating enzyme required for sulfatase activity